MTKFSLLAVYTRLTFPLATLPPRPVELTMPVSPVVKQSVSRNELLNLVSTHILLGLTLSAVGCLTNFVICDIVEGYAGSCLPGYCHRWKLDRMK